MRTALTSVVQVTRAAERILGLVLKARHIPMMALQLKDFARLQGVYLFDVTRALMPLSA